MGVKGGEKRNGNCCSAEFPSSAAFTKYLNIRTFKQSTFSLHIYMACVLHIQNKLTCTDWKVLNVESLFCSKIQINLDYEIEIDQWRWWSVNGDGRWKQEKVTTMTTEARADAFLLRQWGEDKEETTNVRSGSKSSKLDQLKPLYYSTLSKGWVYKSRINHDLTLFSEEYQSLVKGPLLMI